MPLLTAYALSRHERREPKRLFRRIEGALGRLMEEYARSERNEGAKPKQKTEKAGGGAARKHSGAMSKKSARKPRGG
jgi:hypothetical protein